MELDSALGLSKLLSDGLRVETLIDDDDVVTFLFDRAPYTCRPNPNGLPQLETYIEVPPGRSSDRLRAVLNDEAGVRRGIGMEVSVDSRRVRLHLASQAERPGDEERRRILFETLRELAVTRRSIVAALSVSDEEPVPPLYLDVEPDDFAEFREGILAGAFSPIAYIPDADDVTKLIIGLDAARIAKRCGCGDAECRTYYFIGPAKSNRTIRLEASGEALLDVTYDMELCAAERLLH